MYTLGDGIDPERGWGRRDETWSVKEELAAYGVEPTWFGLGDRDVATHLVRTQMLDAGYPLSEVTEALGKRWQPGVRLLPMTDDRVETHVAVADAESPSGRRVVHFQEYWIKLRAEVPAQAVVLGGLDDSAPGPGVIDAITDADLVILPPSNPVVSVGTILGVPRVREAVAATKAPVVGLLPHRRCTHVRGMAQQMLTSDRRRGQRRGRRAPLRSAWPGRSPRRLAGRRAGRRRADRIARGRTRRGRRTADDDRPRSHRGDGRGGHRAGRLVTIDGVSAFAPDGVPEVRPGDDLAALLLPTGRAGRRRHRGRDEQGRQQGRGPRGCGHQGRSCCPARPCGWSLAAARPASSATGRA